MKNIFSVLIVAICLFGFLSGCGTLSQYSTLKELVKASDFLEHETAFKNWAHMKYSLWEYRNPNEETFRKTQEEEWWGIAQKWQPESENSFISSKDFEKK